MTTSANLIARVRSLCRAEAVKNGETPMVVAALEMAREYEIAVEQNLRMEATIHNGVKALEELMAK